jgi:hypothetical protein
MPVHDPGGEKDLFSPKNPEVSYAEEGAAPLAAKGLKFCSMFSLCHYFLCSHLMEILDLRLIIRGNEMPGPPSILNNPITVVLSSDPSFFCEVCSD